ncbi:MAG: hypothetical protein BMS9Abin31_0118 [Gammaproteobacteria bacterium]|nr:MAG: hypothetical protein BMS9Abin31_0118 [Gammaproteobacteria bacterium]
MYLKKYVNKIKAEPMIFFIGLCIIALAVMGTSVRHVSSTMFAVLFLLSLTTIKDWAKVFSSLSKLEKLFLFSFVLYTISGIVSYYNVEDIDKYYKLFERYLRFTLIIPVYLLIVRKNVSVLNYLFFGAVLSGPFLIAVSIQHYLANPATPAQGYYHHIIFGQLAMLNVGIMLSLLLTKELDRKLQFVISVSILCGTAAAVMSQARGVWLVFPIYVIIAIYYTVKEKRLGINSVIAFFIAAILLSVFTPIDTLIKKRTEEAAVEVSRFYTEDQYISSVGTRLAMWDIAIDIWKRHPILGTGPGDIDDEIMLLKKKGEYAGMELHNSVHNIYIQALVGSGIIGLAALLFVLLFMPLKLFFDKCNKEGGLIGFIIVVSFAIFGFSESWTLRLPPISIFLVFIITVASHMRIAGSKDKC